ncbi:MAG: LiaF domain-containing protein [Spirochaetota bacterium]
MKDLQSYDDVPLEKIRDTIIEELQDYYARGNMEIQEYELLLERLNRVRTKADLEALVPDLPRISGPPQRNTCGNAPGAAAINRGFVREEESLIAILGESKRRGVWNPPRTLKVFSLMGDVEVDLTAAQMPPGVTTIEILSIMSDVKIIVPAGFNVALSGLPILSSFRNMTSGYAKAGYPEIKVTGISIMSDVKVKERTA